MAEILQFSNYPPDRFLRLEANLATKGLTIVNDSGEEKKDGADLLYSYVPGTQVLTITINKAPWLHNLAGFCQEISEFIEGQT